MFAYNGTVFWGLSTTNNTAFYYVDKLGTTFAPDAGSVGGKPTATGMKRATLFLLLLIESSCQTAPDIVQPGPGLIGSWQYVERGYSPGAGYIVDQIPKTPVQRVDFLPNSTLRTANISDQLFARGRTYRLDSTQYGRSVLLFDGEGEIVGLSMTMRIRNDTLRLSPPCIEGCHFAFVRLRQ